MQLKVGDGFAKVNGPGRQMAKHFFYTWLFQQSDYKQPLEGVLHSYWFDISNHSQRFDYGQPQANLYTSSGADLRSMFILMGLITYNHCQVYCAPTDFRLIILIGFLVNRQPALKAGQTHEVNRPKWLNLWPESSLISMFILIGLITYNHCQVCCAPALRSMINLMGFLVNRQLLLKNSFLDTRGQQTIERMNLWPESNTTVKHINSNFSTDSNPQQKNIKNSIIAFNPLWPWKVTAMI